MVRKNLMCRKILYIQYTNPGGYPPLEHSSRILANAGWEVLFLGITMSGTKTLQFPPHERIKVQLLPSYSAGWRQKLHYLKYCLWVLIWTLRWRPGWVYASNPLSCPVALVLSYLPGVHVIYHEHDSPMPNNPVTNDPMPNNPVTNDLMTNDYPTNDSLTNDYHPSYFMRFILWTRRYLARRAQLCVLPNEQRAKIFKEVTGGNRVLTVWNCPSRDEVGPPKEPNMDGKLRLYYHGNIGSSYLPLSLLEAIATLPDVHLQIIGYETASTRGYANRLKEEAKRLGLEKRVEILGAMPRYQLLEYCRACNVGLAFIPKNDEDINNKYKLGASNRPFDYLACGFALLVTDLPDWREIYVEPGYGLACDPEDPESIASALRWFLEHPEEMRAMGERGRQRILTEWNYETQFAPLLKPMTEKRP